MTKITLKDIAKTMGISTATVSYALNDAPGVSEELRDAIKQTARAMNYQTNFSARSLARSKTNTIAWIRTSTQANTDPFAMTVFSLTAAELQRHGYDTLLHTLNLNADTFSATDLFAAQRVDAAILSSHLPPPMLLNLLKQAQPLIGLELDVHYPQLPCVWPNYRQGIQTLFDYLVSRGHSRIAFLAADPLEPTAKQRLEGFYAGYQKHGLILDPMLIAGHSYDFHAAKQAARQLLDRDPRPQAIMATTDRMAIAAIQAAQELGLQVPEDVAITGFDDSEFAVYVRPALTNVRLDPLHIAQKLTQLTLARIEHPNQEHADWYAIPVTLNIRQSA